MALTVIGSISGLGIVLALIALCTLIVIGLLAEVIYEVSASILESILESIINVFRSRQRSTHAPIAPPSEADGDESPESERREG